MTLKTWLGAVSFGILSLLAASRKINLQLTAEEQLFAWVRSFGGQVDGITLMNPGDGPRGLFTTKEFVNESIIMVIPPEVMIHKADSKRVPANVDINVPGIQFSHEDNPGKPL